MDKMLIQIDATEWLKEYRESEERAANEDDLRTLAIERGRQSKQIARFYLVERELGLADEEILPPNITLLNNGGTNAVDIVFRRLVREIEVGEKTFQVREMVGPFMEKADDAPDDEKQEQKWTSLGTPEALDNAMTYIKRRITGLLVGRLLVIRESGGDIDAAINWLQDWLDAIREDLKHD